MTANGKALAKKGIYSTLLNGSTKVKLITKGSITFVCPFFANVVLCAVKFQLTMFDNIKVFKTKIVKPRIKHQCVKCGGKIEPKRECVNTTFSYDGRLISVYFCNREGCRF